MKKLHNFHLPCLALCLTLTFSHGLSQFPPNQTQPFSQLATEPQEWRLYNLSIFQQSTDLKLNMPTVSAGLLCFLAASISSAGGIGGGGLFVPILVIVAGLELQTASSFSAFMVTGGSIANVMYNLFGGKALIDYDIALLSEPCMLLGVSIGVICNLMFPEWLTTILFAVFLAWSTTKTCRNGLWYWKLESEVAKRAKNYTNLENGNGKIDNLDDGNEGLESTKEPLLGVNEENHNKLNLPWKNLGLLLMVWLSFFVVYLLRGNKYGQGLMPIKHCGVGYWVISSIQIPLAIVFTVWIICRTDCSKFQTPKHQDLEYLAIHTPPNKLIFPLMALLAGILGGVFGIGGGMLISPLLLHLGVTPEVTAATCSFMVFFSSTMSAFQYLLTGMESVETALIFSVICFVASLVGLMLVQEMIRNHGRASLIVFSVSIVMALSTVLITGFGAVDVWKDFVLGNYMGFKRPC